MLCFSLESNLRPLSKTLSGVKVIASAGVLPLFHTTKSGDDRGKDKEGIPV